MAVDSTLLLRVIRQFRRYYDRQFEDLLAASGLSMREMDVVLFLANNPGCDTAREVAELRGGGMDEALRSWLEAQAAREAGESIAAALALCQRLECDCLHLGPRAALAVPWEKEALKEQWPAAFAGLELQLDVQAAVARM